MLQRSVHRSLQRQWHSIHHSGHVCACRCGQQFTTPDVNQRRTATRRAAPSTFDRRDRLKRRVLSREELQHSKEMDTMKHDVFYDALMELYTGEAIAIHPDQALDFLNDFDELARKIKGLPTVSVEDFAALVEKYHISFDDCRSLSRYLLVTWGFLPERQFLGRKLLLSTSRAGDEEATINVMGHAALQNLKKPGTLKSKEIQYAREHLLRIVAAGHNYRATVLQGRIAEMNGDATTAIRLWTSAMASAVEASAEQERLRKAGVDIPEHERRDQFELTTPWIDLFEVHRRRGEANQANWALEIGCQQDDPHAHYLYADYSCLRYEDYEQTVPMHTSDWLYHMTKAATSGHHKAAFELGEYYAQSSWKYIEDEPPDDVKPTPFDSYPAPNKTKAIGYMNHLLCFLGLKQIEPPRRRQIFDVAMFPHTAVERFRMAVHWIEIANTYGYAPGCLLMAKIHMQETLQSSRSSPRTAPNSALELKDERYTYSSKEDFEQGIPKEPLNEEDEDEIDPGPPNPYYSLESARGFLREVFYAYQANSKVVLAQKAYARQRRQGLVKAVADDHEIVSEDNFQNLPMHIRKWMRNPDVRRQYEDDIDDMYEEAKAICDAEGWDLYDDNGGLVYRAKRSGGKS